ncbi:MAG: hypothetical protein ABIO70_28975 [Pseudomonadota bacterium]
MTTKPPLDFCASLREQLALAGPPAVEMLTGRAPPDTLILLSAVQAAGLLDETTAGSPDLRRLRREILRAAESSAALEAAVAALDPEAQIHELPELPPDEQEDALHRLVALAGLAEAGPPAVRRRIEPALSHLEACAIMDPGRLVALADLSVWLTDQLDLHDEHRAVRLLGHLSETPLLAGLEVDDEATRRTIAALSTSMGLSMVAEWAEKLLGCTRVLADLLPCLEPELRSAPPGSLAGQLPRRMPLYIDPPEYIAVCLFRGEMYLEWSGPPERCPVRVVLDPAGIELAREEETFTRDTVVWSFGWPPPGDVAGLVLHRGGGALRVSLADLQPTS